MFICVIVMDLSYFHRTNIIRKREGRFHEATLLPSDETRFGLRRARILRVNLAEVYIGCNRPSTAIGEGQSQQRPILGILPEVILVAWDVVTKLPDTLALHIANAVERVEDCRLTIVSLRY